VGGVQRVQKKTVSPPATGAFARPLLPAATAAMALLLLPWRTRGLLCAHVLTHACVCVLTGLIVVLLL